MGMHSAMRKYRQDLEDQLAY